MNSHAEVTKIASPVIATPIKRQMPHDEIWNHPALALFDRPSEKNIPLTHSATRLSLVPTTFDDQYEPGFAPVPTPKSELPELEPWVKRLTISLLEIWSGRRSAIQVSRWCHRTIYNELLRKIGTFSATPRLRKIYIKEPIECVGEVVVTLRCGDRVRSLVMRVEGVDRRWLCTELYLI